MTQTTTYGLTLTSFQNTVTLRGCPLSYGERLEMGARLE